jgi:hypothetical protein
LLARRSSLTLVVMSCVSSSLVRAAISYREGVAGGGDRAVGGRGGPDTTPPPPPPPPDNLR